MKVSSTQVDVRGDVIAVLERPSFARSVGGLMLGLMLPYAVLLVPFAVLTDRVSNAWWWWCLFGGVAVGLALRVIGRPVRLHVGNSHLTEVSRWSRRQVRLDRLSSVELTPDGPWQSGRAGSTGHHCAIRDRDGGELSFPKPSTFRDEEPLWRQVLHAARKADIRLGGPTQDLFVRLVHGRDPAALAADRSRRPDELPTGRGPSTLSEWPSKRVMHVAAAELVVGPDENDRQRLDLADLTSVELSPDDLGPYGDGPFDPHGNNWELFWADDGWPKLVLRDGADRSLTVTTANHWRPALPLWQHVCAAAQRNDLALTANTRWMLRYLAGLNPEG